MVLMARRMKDDDNLEEIKAAFKGEHKLNVQIINQLYESTTSTVFQSLILIDPLRSSLTLTPSVPVLTATLVFQSLTATARARSTPTS